MEIGISLISMNQYLKNTTDYYNKRFTENKFVITDNEILRWKIIEKHLSQLLPKGPASKITILDFGCGTGWLSSYLSKYGEVTGVDISNKSIDAAKNKYSRINFIHLDASSGNQIEELIQNKFDIIVSSEVIEHIKEQREYINNIFSLLKDNGSFIMTTPNGKWKKNYFFGYRKNWGQPYEFWITKIGLRNLVHHKFKEYSIKTFGSNWIFNVKSYGLPDLLGNRIIRKTLEILHVKWLYESILNQLGFGLYLIITGKK